jgi:hypothetical protein
MSAQQQMLLAGRGDVSVLVHHTGEGGSEGAYVAAAGSAFIQFANTGQFTGSGSAGATTPYTWLLAGLAADAEILIHQVSGTAVTGIALDTWLALGTTRGCSLAWPGGVSSSSASIQVSMRDRISGNLKVNAVTLALATHP